MDEYERSKQAKRQIQNANHLSYTIHLFTAPYHPPLYPFTLPSLSVFIYAHPLTQPQPLNLPILQTRIQRLIHRHRPHTIPPTLSIRKHKRKLLRETQLALDSTQVQAQAALGTCPRPSSCDGGRRRRTGSQGIGSSGVRVVAAVAVCERRWQAREYGGLCKAQVAFLL